MAFKFIFICNACNHGTESWPVVKAHFRSHPEHVYGGNSAVTVLPLTLEEYAKHNPLKEVNNGDV